MQLYNEIQCQIQYGSLDLMELCRLSWILIFFCQVSPQPNDSAWGMLSLTLHTSLSTQATTRTQWLSVGVAEFHSKVVYVKKGVWLTCWADWFLEACRFVNLWATNQEVPFTVASHCRSRSCWNWPCSYRTPDSGKSGCFNDHCNIRTVVLHQLTMNTAFSCLLGLISQCC